MHRLAAILALALGLPAAAGADDLQVSHAMLRAAPPGAPAGGYLVIQNTGPEADALIGAASPVAGSVELHSMTMEDGVMLMRPVEAIPLPAGERVILSPGGLHLMLHDLDETLVAGDVHPVELRFREAGTVALDVPVRSLGAVRAAFEALDAEAAPHGAAHGEGH